MQLQPVKSNSLVQEVSRQLMALVSGIQPGESDKLPAERKLAEKLGVARGVVREAVKRLETQGILEVKQGCGIRAVKLLHKSLNSSLEFVLPDVTERLVQLTETRIVIEPQVAAFAAEKAEPAQIARLQAVHQELIVADNVKASTEADISFHQTIADIAGNQILKLVLDSTSDLRKESAIRTHTKVGKEVAVAHHQAILEAIENGDQQAASRSMRDHLVAAMEDLSLKSNRRIAG
jgi:GntR family transcriptional repressor for pyruvate dehydrogenase complex